MTAEIQDLDVVETRKLASFRIVDSIEPIEGADAIELAVVGGWKVVTKKGEFQPQDPCVYFEIDSFMPDGVPAWQFLIDKSPRMFNGVRGHKLRTIKLRGQISQGLIIKTTDHPATKLVLCLDDEAFEVTAELCTAEQVEEAKYLREGLDEYNLDPRDLNLNRLLNIVKWDPPLNAQLQGLAEGLFPSWIQKTDQERAQNLKDEIFGYEDTVIPANEELGRPEIIRHAKADRSTRYEVTMKMDGSSATFFNRDTEVGVCSRNLQLKISDANKENSFVRALFDNGLNLALPSFGNIAVQGELMGPAIQGNREALTKFTVFVFDIQLLDEHRKATPKERYAIMERLYELGVNPYTFQHSPIMIAPELYVTDVREIPEGFDGFTLDELGLVTMDKLLAAGEGKSIVHAVREGKVYKKLDGTFSWKTISNAYLAKEKD